MEAKGAQIEPQAANRALEKALNNNPGAADEWKRHVQDVIGQIEKSAEETKRWPDVTSMSPESLLKTYLDMYAAGDQFTDSGRDAMQGLTSVGLNTDALRMIHIIKGYEIVSREIASGKAVFGVTFHVIGSLADDLVFEVKRDDVRIEISLRRYRDGWEIQTPLGPFVSWQAMTQRFRKEKLTLEREAAEQDRNHQKGILINEQLIRKITRAARRCRLVLRTGVTT